MIKKILTHNSVLLVLLSFYFSFKAFSQNADIPQKPSPQRMVNDYAGFLTQDEQNRLESKLIAYNNATSTQIVVVIVKSLNGFDVSDMAVHIIESWGIGQKGKDNGILILIQPKTAEEQGRIAISTGYGVEHLVTDALSKRIIDNEMIPSFKQSLYFDGIDKAVNTLISLTKGEFTADQYMKRTKHKEGSYGALLIVLVIIFFFVILGSKSQNGGNSNISSTGTGALPFFLLMGMMGSGRSSGGSFGDFGSGGGDFGGFGGGMGGGGGASGGW